MVTRFPWRGDPVALLVKMTILSFHPQAEPVVAAMEGCVAFLFCLKKGESEPRCLFVDFPYLIEYYYFSPVFVKKNLLGKL